MKRYYFIFLAALSLIIVHFTGCDSQGSINVFLRSVDQNDDGSGIAVGDEGNIYVTDEMPSKGWEPMHSGVTVDLNEIKIRKDQWGIAPVDSSIAYTVGDQGVILRSTDKGYSWQIINSPTAGFPDLNSVDILHSAGAGMTHIIAAGNSGKIVMTGINQGNWVLLDRSVNTTKKFNSIAVAFTNLFVAVGDSGVIYRTIDGGATWENRSISANITLNCVTNMRYDSYCAVGSNGAIYISTDYGYTWTPRTSNTTNDLNTVLFMNIDSGAAAGNNGTVRYTTNRGLTWITNSQLNNLTANNIKSICFFAGNTVNSVSHRSAATEKLTDSTFFIAVSSQPFSSIEPISNQIAKIFDLGQNYPNPFNPETKIRFDIPQNIRSQKINVNITIYDIQGKQVHIIFNEELKTGVYEVTWDGSGYPSGVYFYTISAGNYKQTKKMVLIK